MTPDLGHHRLVPREYYIYILTNATYTVLYTGMTNDNIRRVWEHLKRKSADSFSARYNVCIPVYCAIYPDARSAIAAEKMIKGWTRARKLDLIESMNPEWRDLSEEPVRS